MQRCPPWRPLGAQGIREFSALQPQASGFSLTVVTVRTVAVLELTFAIDLTHVFTVSVYPQACVLFVSTPAVLAGLCVVCKYSSLKCDGELRLNGPRVRTTLETSSQNQRDFMERSHYQKGGETLALDQ